VSAATSVPATPGQCQARLRCHEYQPEQRKRRCQSRSGAGCFHNPFLLKGQLVGRA